MTETRSIPFAPAQTKRPSSQQCALSRSPPQYLPRETLSSPPHCLSSPRAVAAERREWTCFSSDSPRTPSSPRRTAPSPPRYPRGRWGCPGPGSPPRKCGRDCGFPSRVCGRCMLLAFLTPSQVCGRWYTPPAFLTPLHPFDHHSTLSAFLTPPHTFDHHSTLHGLLTPPHVLDHHSTLHALRNPSHPFDHHSTPPALPTPPRTASRSATPRRSGAWADCLLLRSPSTPPPLTRRSAPITVSRGRRRKCSLFCLS